MSGGAEPKKTQDLTFRSIVDGVRHRIVVFSGKGGVGKTTVAVNLAYALVNRGRRVGLLDADITGPNVVQMTGVTGTLRGTEERILPHDHRGLKLVSLASMLPAEAPVIWRGPMRSKVTEQFLETTAWGDLDALVVDLPPGTGDEVLTVVQRIAPQVAVVVTTPQEVSWIDARRAVSFAKELGIGRIGIVENMSGFACPHCGEPIHLFGEGKGKEESRRLGVEWFGAIPVDPGAPAAGDQGRPLVLTRPDSAIAGALDRVAALAMGEPAE
ncbi:MAG: Mrp/NBP35 family ATP-binding protein [Candidatus Bipolaricaulia bacterium]